jgi:hypothetical protein
MRCIRYLAWSLLPLLLLGCGKGVKVVPVSGRVTMDNKPLANADITFSSTETSPNNTPIPESSGRTDDQGRFTLTVNQDKRNGAAIGKHKVRISQMERGATLVNRVPKNYNQNTTLTFTVPAEGTSEANFDLSSKGN